VKLSIERLTPNLAKTYVDYVDGLSFEHEPRWSSCFCRWYHTECSIEEWQKRTAAENRQEALEEIARGNMRGYLAFDQDKCIGWCNANNAQQFVRLRSHLEPFIEGRKIGCVICFIIHPEYRGRGVARQLLARAIEDFKNDGYDGVLALPVEMEGDRQKMYRGTLSMYREQGFQLIEEHDSVRVMFLEFVEGGLPHENIPG